MQGLEHVPSAHGLHGHADAREHFRGQPRGPETQPLEVVHGLDRFAEPALPLRAGVAAEERLQTEPAVHFVIERLAAAVG